MISLTQSYRNSNARGRDRCTYNVCRRFRQERSKQFHITKQLEWIQTRSCACSVGY